jgi:hypothetical protein
MHAWVYWLAYVPFLLDVPHHKIPLSTKLIIPKGTHLLQKLQQINQNGCK